MAGVETLSRSTGMDEGLEFEADVERPRRATSYSQSAGGIDALPDLSARGVLPIGALAGGSSGPKLCSSVTARTAILAASFAANSARDVHRLTSAAL